MTTANEITLRVFERNIFRRIFGVVNDSGDWRMRNNQQLDGLITRRKQGGAGRILTLAGKYKV